MSSPSTAQRRSHLGRVREDTPRGPESTQLAHAHSDIFQHAGAVQLVTFVSGHRKGLRGLQRLRKGSKRRFVAFELEESLTFGGQRRDVLELHGGFPGG